MNVLAILVELVGTFVFLSVIVATGNPLAIATTLGVLIYLGIDVSGGHFNPAVTIMTLFNNGIAVDTASGYVIAQIVAGLAAVTLHNYMKQRGILK
jgi:glycerol uptake facilitator-like aquaporin